MSMAAQQTSIGKLMQHESMSKHCSWRAGGTAESFYQPADKQDLSRFLATLDTDVAVTWIGLGSNLLVRDGGIKGVVIGSLSRLNELNILDDGSVYAECGVTCSRLARFCKQNSLYGAEFLAGIPGTVGGALAMNAGAFGSETWDFVKSVEMMNRNGDLIQRNENYFDVTYRSVKMNEGEWFSAGYFNFSDDANANQSNIKQLLQKRNDTQPIGLPSCGSVFKNPPGDYSARLIEACDLKGHCIGGACVSEKHANFIINQNNASAADIEDLIHHVREQVLQRFNIELKTEVRIIGQRLTEAGDE